MLFSYPVVPQVDVALQEEQIGEGAGGRREAGVFAAHPAEKVHPSFLCAKKTQLNMRLNVNY